MVDNVNYNAFRENDSPTPLNEGLNINNKKSRFKKEQKFESTDFDQDVNNHIKEQHENKFKAMELTKRYWASIRDRTLKENKGPVEDQLEKETVEKFSKLSLELNGNHNLPEGIGSVGMCVLLMQICLYQRDIINNLQYKVAVLEKKMSSDDK